jgi:hypothetical protein
MIVVGTIVVQTSISAAGFDSSAPVGAAVFIPGAGAPGMNAQT